MADTGTTSEASEGNVPPVAAAAMADNLIPPPIPTQEANEECLRSAPRGPAQERWKPSKISLLISLKRQEFELSFHQTARDRMRTADKKWGAIQEGLAAKSVTRTRVQIRKRWEKMLTDFKKIYDYQQNIPSGEEGYYEMASDKRRKKKLPPIFAHEYYHALESWIPNQRAINPSQGQVMDSSNEVEEGASNGSQSEPVGGPRRPAPTANPTGSDHAESARSNVGGEGDNENPPDTTQYQRSKKSKSARLDNHFGKANALFIEAMARQAEKTAQHKKDLLDWDKEKTEGITSLECRKLTESLAVQREVGTEISGALCDVSASFCFFAAEIAKKKE